MANRRNPHHEIVSKVICYREAVTDRWTWKAVGRNNRCLFKGDDAGRGRDAYRKTFEIASSVASQLNPNGVPVLITYDKKWGVIQRVVMTLDTRKAV